MNHPDHAPDDHREPVQPNPPDTTDDRIEALLRARAGEVVPDAGFAAGVVAALPPRRRPWAAASDWLLAGLAGIGAFLWGPSAIDALKDALSATAGETGASLASLLADPTMRLPLGIAATALILLWAEADAEPAERPNDGDQS